MSIFEFSDALVREPTQSVVDGLRAVDRGAPSFDGVKAEQAQYISALEAAGVTVEVLPGLANFPDSIFVEDAALVFPGAAILLRPGAPSRRGEADAIAPHLTRRFERLLRLNEGSVEGGDVLIAPSKVFIGRSERTDADGARALSRVLAEIGLRGEPVATPPGVLHLKSDCSLLDEETILATARLASAGVFEGFRVVLTPEGEEAAANAVRVNDCVLISDAFPRTAELLARLGYPLSPLRAREIAKIDAGLSCMSLRWRAR